MRATGLLVAVLVTATGCSGPSPAAAPAAPAASGGDPSSARTFTVVARDLAVRYKLQGVSQAGARVGLVRPDNTAVDLDVEVGQQVTKGQRIGSVVPDVETLAALRAESARSTVARSQAAGLQARGGPVTAPVSGALVESGGRPWIRSAGLDAVVRLTPLQVLRFQALKFTGQALVETVYGPRRARCEGLWLEPSIEDGSTDGGEVAAADLHCRVPSDVESAPGLPLVLTLESAPLKGIVAVPAVYVGLDKAGADYVVYRRQGAAAKPTPVVVGASDGVVRVITSGLKPGDVVERLPADG